MYSVNVPVPGRVARLASDLAPQLAGFEQVRDRHTLVLKRLGDPEPHELAHLEQRARRALAGTGPFEVRITGIDTFERPPVGIGPVVYLGVESQGLWDAHRRLVEEFSAVEPLEGDDYTPHVSLARGGAHEAAARLTGREVDPVTWTVDELVFRDGQPGSGTTAGRVPLPA